MRWISIIVTWVWKLFEITKELPVFFWGRFTQCDLRKRTEISGEKEQKFQEKTFSSTKNYFKNSKTCTELLCGVGLQFQRLIIKVLYTAPNKSKLKIFLKLYGVTGNTHVLPVKIKYSTISRYRRQTTAKYKKPPKGRRLPKQYMWYLFSQAKRKRDDDNGY